MAQYALGGSWPTSVFAALAGRAGSVLDWLAALVAVLVATVTGDACIFARHERSRGPRRRASLLKCSRCPALQRSARPRSAWSSPAPPSRPGGAGAAGAAHTPDRRRLPRLHRRPRAAGEPALLHEVTSLLHAATARRRSATSSTRCARRSGPRWPSSSCSGRPVARAPPSAAAARARSRRHGAARRPRGPPPAAPLATASGALTTRTGTGRGTQLDTLRGQPRTQGRHGRRPAHRGPGARPAPRGWPHR